MDDALHRRANGAFIQPTETNLAGGICIGNMRLIQRKTKSDSHDFIFLDWLNHRYLRQMCPECVANPG